jgi:hypothetical protein
MAGSDKQSMVPTPSDNQLGLFAAAQRLRTVRTACRRFLMLWAMSPKKNRPNLKLDSAFNDPEALLRAMSDPQNHDWSLLYRGSVLDD